MNDSEQSIPASEPEPNPPAESTPLPAAGQAADLPPAVSLPGPIAPLPFPMTLSKILERFLHLLRTHFVLLTGVAVIPFAALFLVLGIPIGALINAQIRNSLAPGSTPDLPWLFAPLMLLAIAVCIPLTAWQMASASHASLSADAGIHLTITECLRLGWERLGRSTALMLLMELSVLAPLLVVLFPCIVLIPTIHNATGSAAAAFFLVPLLLIAFVGGYVWMFVLMLRLSLAFPAAVAEDLGPLEAIRRSSQLTRGAKGRIFSAILLIYAFTYTLILIVIFVLAGLGIGIAVVSGGFHGVAGTLLHSLEISLISVLFFIMMLISTAIPMAAIFATLAIFYRDQRLRIDGVVLPAAQ